MPILNSAVKYYVYWKYKRIEDIRSNTPALQQNIFRSLIDKAAHTEYGKKYGFEYIKTQEEFAKQVPIGDYETFKPYIHRQLEGELNVLWPGKVKFFSKSSGTTDKSKFLPVTEDAYYQNHRVSGWDSTSILYKENEETRLFDKKSLIMGGSLKKWDTSEALVGDISGILLHKMPYIAVPFISPSLEIAMLENFEEKLDRMKVHCPKDDIVMIAGVPTWTVVLFNKILEETGKANMQEVWPNAAYYVHGGVGFEPYRPQFEKFFPSGKTKFFEAYNASEGYFAIQDVTDQDGMLLLTDNDIFYEFVAMKDFHGDFPQVTPLEEVEIGKNYAILISTSAGLWRYVMGDTVKFVSKAPYRIKVSGRTKHFINVFGEEVMVGNAEEAIRRTLLEHPAIISEYTVGPRFLEDDKKGGHDWVIEFVKEPRDLNVFAETLDKHLQDINSDYAAKRYKDIALSNLEITSVQQGTFAMWLRINDKVFAQSKIPRLFNDRRYVEELLKINDESNK